MNGHNMTRKYRTLIMMNSYIMDASNLSKCVNQQKSVDIAQRNDIARIFLRCKIVMTPRFDIENMYNI